MISVKWILYYLCNSWHLLNFFCKKHYKNQNNCKYYSTKIILVLFALLLFFFPTQCMSNRRRMKVTSIELKRRKSRPSPSEPNTRPTKQVTHQRLKRRIRPSKHMVCMAKNMNRDDHPLSFLYQDLWRAIGECIIEIRGDYSPIKCLFFLSAIKSLYIN